MKRDISELPTENVNCVEVVDDKTLIVYDNQAVTSYKLVSDKYIPSRTSPAETPPDYAVCHSLEDVSNLPSSYNFIEPVFYNMALIVALFIFWVAYRILIYPFFRKV